MKMIGSDILLAPETGKNAIRALKMALLYSGTVYSLLHDRANLAPDALDHLEQLENDGYPISSRFRNYHSFLNDHRKDFELLKAEGALVTVGDLPFEYAVRKTMEGSEAVAQSFVLDNSNSAWQRIRRFAAERPATFTDAAPMAILAEKNFEEAKPALAQFLKFSQTPLYEEIQLAITLYIAESYGIGIGSWLPSLHDAMVAERELLEKVEPLRLPPSPDARQSLGLTLSQNILSSELPTAEDLPFPEILEIRRKRHAELEAFRIAVGQLACEVNPMATGSQIQLEADRIIAGKIYPALHDLRRALADSRMDALKTIAQSWGSLAKITTPFIISVALGAPVDIQKLAAAIGVIAGAAGPIIAGEIQRIKIRHASQWAILLTLHERKARQ